MGSRGDWINGIIEEDTVQNKLNDEVYAFRGKLPVRQCDVFVTPAGDDSSELKKHNIRFIYHVAVVKASLKGEEKLEGVDGERVVQICVRNCLEKVKTHNTTNPTTPIKRIVFPLLGAGNAGLKVDVSAKQVVEGIKWWLERNVDPNLEGIHINAFRVCDVKTVLAVMNGSRLRSVSISRF